MANPIILNLTDLEVSSFETSTESLSPVLPTTDPTAATRCFYCPPASFDANCLY